MKAFFLSDLHLKKMDEPNAQKFLSFLRQAVKDPDLTHLFLVGDIFDLWISNHAYFRKKFAPIIEQIKQLRLRDVEVHYFEGNHDLYLERFWQDSVDVQVHSDSAIFEMGGLRVRVEHGDLIDKDDRGYRFLRWFLRTPVMTWIAHNLQQTLVAQIGERASRASRAYTSESKTISRQQALAKIRHHAEKLVLREPLDFVISGHLHTRDDIVLTSGKRKIRSVNLGSWFDEQKVFVFAPTEQKFCELTEA